MACQARVGPFRSELDVPTTGARGSASAPAARIVIADTTGAYDGRDLALRPLGGTEASVIQLAEALARRGHDVVCCTRTADRVDHKGVRWMPLGTGGLDGGDLFVAVQHPELMGLARRPRRLALWVLWPPGSLRRGRRAARLWWHRPRPVFVSEFQARNYPAWLPGSRAPLVIPFGLPDAVRRRAPLAAPPPPRAVFASNPQRDLRWLLGLWARAILPAVPGAELHLYGIRDYAYRYGEPWEETEQRLGQFVPDDFPAAARASLRPHPPAGRDELWEAMRAARVMLYGGHRVEAFCLAVAEAQALGVPAVVRPIAVMPERVRDGVTGFVALDGDAFARRAVALLTDDTLWGAQHEAALRLQQGWSWDQMAERFEAEVVLAEGAAPADGRRGRRHDWVGDR
jgi:glycosyltransferase involved in cell wall biosynthesis